MEQTNTPQQPSRKKAILSLLVLLALTCVVVFIFSSHWAEISTALAQLSFWQVLLVLADEPTGAIHGIVGMLRRLRDDTRLSADQIESQVIHSIIGELADAYEGQGRDVLCNGLRGAFLLGSAAEFGRRRAI
mgnify:CR=1 FL=1